MNKLDKKILIIFITILAISFGIYNISFTDNKVKTKATLVDYKYVKGYNYYSDIEEDGWFGIYKFTVDDEEYEFKGKIEYDFKIFVPKTTTVIYNPENPAEFKERNLPIILIILSVIVGISTIESISKKKKE